MFKSHVLGIKGKKMYASQVEEEEEMSGENSNIFRY